jgi:FtsH-binding integral membrane protein
MKRYLFIIIGIAGLAFLIYTASARDWLFMLATLVACFIAERLVQWYSNKKLTKIGSLLIYIIIGVPIMSKIIPSLDLFVLTVASLVYTIWHNSPDTGEKIN